MPVAFSFMGILLDSFQRRFNALHGRSLILIGMVAEDDLYRRPRTLDRSMAAFSIGEYILRSAASVEQTFGGITTRLWDDPFEWTLPEKLSDRASVIEYLNEVDVTRSTGFRFFSSDDDLLKQIPAPETLRPIADLLLETVARAEHFQGRAFAIFQTFSDEKLPGV